MKTKPVSLNEMREALQRRRDELCHMLAEEAREVGTIAHVVGDLVDDTADAENAELHAQMATSESVELEHTEHALSRMAEGQYGMCEKCGRPISTDRLLAIPDATMCVKCQRAADAAMPTSTAPVWRVDREEATDGDDTTDGISEMVARF